MSSGGKEAVFNPTERLLSLDHNRVQKFLRKDVGEFLRYFHDVGYGTDDLDASSVASESLVQTNPLRAEVIGGLLVRPVNASLTLSVDAGLLLCIDPDIGETPGAGDDDSALKYVRDAGKLGDGSLVIASNPTGSIRIDVIECQRATATVESATRDLFNVSTGLFNAATVTKATASSLVYRVRQGSAGAGFPGTAQGWLPLAVASLAPGSTSNDTITFWDVRPMLNDRHPSPQNITLSRPRRLAGLFNGIAPAAVAGFHDVSYNGRRVGGRLRRGTPGTDADTLDLIAVANQSPDVALDEVDGFVGSLVLAVPFGLPRWARYTDASAGPRVPRSPRGIPILTATAMKEDGTPLSPIVMPASLGFNGASTSAAVCIQDFYWASGAVDPTFGDDRSHYVPHTVPNISMSGSGLTRTVVLSGGTHFPSMARYVKLQMSVTFSPTSSGLAHFKGSVSPPNTGGEIGSSETDISVTSGTPISPVVEVWFPLCSAYPSTTPPSYTFTLTESGQSGIFSSPSVSVAGWRY